jgi:glycosyltransferase involved in cell wall biosynthesis
MKILWVFSTFAIGGPQRRAAEIIAGLGTRAEHVILPLDGRREAGAFLPANGAWRMEDVALEKSGFVSFANLRAIRATLRRLAPDLLLTSNWGSIEWAIANRGRSRTPHIHFEDGFGPDETPARQSWKRAAARRLALRDRTVVVPSRTLRDVAVRRWGLKPERVHLIENGVDVARYQSPERRDKGFVVVGSLGALRAEKNYPRLARAVAAARAQAGRDIRLRIFGDGPERRAIETAGEAEWLELPGATATPEIALKDFDVFALSSATEQAPLSLLEAMAAGLAVAATDVGDVKRMVAAENAGFIAPARDETALARSIATLAADSALRRRIGAANAVKAEARYAVENMVAAHVALYERTIAPGDRR